MASTESGGQKQRGKAESETAAAPEEQESTDLAERQEKLTSDVDSLLDEIDDVLEENAEEFVRGYVQKGGQ